MTMNRREFLIGGAGLLAGAAVATIGAGNGTAYAAKGGETVDAGPADAFREDGVYDRFRYQGFLLIRKGERFIALSSLCTHRACQLKIAPDKSFICPCHGSTFDPEGLVTKGPAERNLPQLPTRIDGTGRLLVEVPG